MTRLNHHLRLVILVYTASLFLHSIVSAEDHDGHDEHDHQQVHQEKDWIDEIMTFYKQKAPEFSDELHRLKKDAPEEAHHFWEEMTEIYNIYREELEEQKDAAETFLSHERLNLRSRILGHKIRLLHERNREHPTKERAADIKKLQAELRELLSSIFDQRSAQIAKEASMLEAEAKELKTVLEKRKQHRQSMIEKRLNMLSGSDDDLEW